ncbi:MAG: Maf family nucleotide pyrophosphatase [Cytophagaceae bacterium]
MFINYPLILASVSPRRQQILTEAGISFIVKSKAVPEIYSPELSPYEVPLYLSEIKAEALLEDITNEVVLAADTIVLLEGRILEKPADRTHAINMLSELSGKKHEVITGVTLLNKNKAFSFTDRTDVYFKTLPPEDISYYVDTFKPFDKAGGYGIQEWIGLIGIEKIDGSFYNVMGLPIHRVIDELIQFPTSKNTIIL